MSTTRYVTLSLITVILSLASAASTCATFADAEHDAANSEQSTSPSPVSAPIFREANRDEQFPSSGPAAKEIANSSSGRANNKTDVDATLAAVQARLMQELRKFRKSDSYKQGLFEVELEADNLRVWNVKLFISEGPLHEDLLKLKGMGRQDHIMLQVSFNDKYPSEPPFVRVLYPVLRGGYVGDTGALCMNILTKNGWNTSCTTEAFILTIFSALVGKPARVEFGWTLPELDDRYSEKGAREEFDAIKRTHDGW